MLKNILLLLWVLGISPLLHADPSDNAIQHGDSGGGISTPSSDQEFRNSKDRAQSNEKRCVCVFESSHLSVYLDPRCRGEAGRVDSGENNARELPSDAVKENGCPPKGMVILYQREKSTDRCTAKTQTPARCKEK